MVGFIHGGVHSWWGSFMVGFIHGGVNACVMLVKAVKTNC